MKKHNLIKNTLILILGGFLTKILGFLIKILYTRYLKEEGVSLISLIFPTYSLLITITSFALPLAVTKLTAENKIRKSKILFSSFWITMFINIIVITFVFLFADYFALHFLHEQKCGFLIKILCSTLPFVSTTSLIKAYFFGRENVIPVIISNVSEEILKFTMVITLLPKMIEKGTMYGVSFYLFINLLCEFISFFSLYIFLPRKIKFKNLDYKYDSKCTSRITKICIPTLSGRLIGNIGYFFEPIILTNMLIYKGFNPSYIRLNYGYFQGYVIALLTIPSFFLVALSSNMVPAISKLKTKKDFSKIKKMIQRIILLVLISGLIYMLILKLYGKNIMMLLYKTKKGYKYLKLLLPFFGLFYIESPILSSLQSLDQEKKVFKITSLGIVVKYFSLIALILFGQGFKSIVISEIINIIFVIFLGIYYLNNYFRNSLKK